MHKMPLVKQNKSANSSTDQSMHFWGVCCESGKQYEQIVDHRFRITMAVLDPKSSSKSGDKTVSLIVIRGGVEYLLCVLKHEEIHQVNLNLIFDKGENVIFYINGYGKVYLSGYQLTDSEHDVLNDENGYLCPLVEVASDPQPEQKGKGKMQNSTPRSMSKGKKKSEVYVIDVPDKKIKQGRNKYCNEDNNIQDLEFDEESESDDDDFQVGEESESDDDSDESEEDDDDDDDDDDEEDDEMEMEKIVLSKKSQKRKIENMSQPQKRSKVDSFTSSPSAVETSKNVSHFDDNDTKDSSDSGALDSSIGNTPMPKKQAKMEKKSKKKKRLSEISNLSEKSVKGQKLPTSGSTSNKNDNPIKKLESGVEIQDVVVGRGPEARVGKMVHVFYIGRLPDKQIFDSRLPGKKPFSFKLGAHEVIKGWDIGIQGMRVGGKRKLKIPPNLGYGNAGVEGIPGNSVLFFVVELQAVS